MQKPLNKQLYTDLKVYSKNINKTFESIVLTNLKELISDIYQYTHKRKFKDILYYI